MRKILFSAIAAAAGAALAISGMSLAPAAAYADEVYEIYIGGVLVTASNKYNVTGSGIKSGSVRVLPSSDDDKYPTTIYLTNTTIDTTGISKTSGEQRTCGIYIGEKQGPVRIVLSGNNTIRPTACSTIGGETCVGIQSGSDLLIEGNNRTADTLTVYPASVFSGYSAMGVDVDGNLKISQATLTSQATGTPVDTSLLTTEWTSIPSPTIGINAHKDVTAYKAYVLGIGGEFGGTKGLSIGIRAQVGNIIGAYSDVIGTTKSLSTDQGKNKGAESGAYIVPMGSGRMSFGSSGYSVSGSWDEMFANCEYTINSDHSNPQPHVLAAQKYNTTTYNGQADSSLPVMYGLYIGGVSVTSKNYSKITAPTITGSVSFIPDTPGDPTSSGTIKMNNATIMGYITDKADLRFSPAIYDEYVNKLTLQLTGTNELYAVKHSEIDWQYLCGIYTGNTDLFIEGNSSSTSKLFVRLLAPGSDRIPTFSGIITYKNLYVHNTRLDIRIPELSGDLVRGMGIAAEDARFASSQLNITSTKAVSTPSKSGFIYGIAANNITFSSTEALISAKGTFNVPAMAVHSTSPEGTVISSSMDKGVTLIGETYAIDSGSISCMTSTSIAAYTSSDKSKKASYSPTSIQQYKRIDLDGGSKETVGYDYLRIIPNGTYVITALDAPTKAIDIAGGSTINGANAQLWEKNGSAAQKFALNYSYATGNYTIKCEPSGKYLEVIGGKMANNSNIRQYSYNGSLAQQWKITRCYGGGFQILSAKDQTYAIDKTNNSTKNGTNIRLYKNSDSDRQNWKFTSTPSIVSAWKTIMPGTYTVKSKINTSKVLDLANGSSKNGANIRLWTNNGSKAQKFTFTYDGDGYYTITNTKSKKVLDVAGSSSKNGANVQQWTSNKTDAQKWRVMKNSDGSYTLKNKASGKVLDVKNGSTKNGANVQQWSGNGNKAQKWVIS